MSGFVHFGVRSCYSLLEGALSLDTVVSLCRQHSMPAVAVADRGNLFGALEFSLAAVKRGIQPIMGCLLGVSLEDELRKKPYYVPLYVQNEAGWRNLVWLASSSFRAIDAHVPPQVSWDMLEAHHEGLLAFSGGVDGPLIAPFIDGQPQKAQGYAEKLRSLFTERFYIQIMRHGYDHERGSEPMLLDLASSLDCPPIAVNDCCYEDESFAESHNVLRCIDEQLYLDEMGARRALTTHAFRSQKAMIELFADVPICCEQTIACAKRCAWFPERTKASLPSFCDDKGNATDEVSLIQQKARLALDSKLEGVLASTASDNKQAVTESYRQRLDYELEVICKMGFAGYFLIVADFIAWAREQAIAVGPGRGSGAGSMVAWCLGITDLDPIRFGLLFERFLNPDRVSMPDFDIDFCQERRDDVIRYVRDRYGDDRVAHIITFGRLKARAALRDVGRTLKMRYGKVDSICKMVPFQAVGDTPLKEILANEPALKKMAENDSDVGQLVRIASAIQGLYRHASTHAAGVVISNKPLNEHIPLYYDKKSDLPATQYSMKFIEDAGLVKFDFLGLKTLTVLDNCVSLIREAGGDVDIANLPLDDAATYKMIGEGDTVGVFQLESAGMRRVLRDVRPDRFEDIIALVALYRPGPMDNIDDYVARKHRRKEVDYYDERLQDILAETYGVIIYQEQVMQIAQALSGFTLAKADILRKAMGKKEMKVMSSLRRDFVDGAEARGMSQQKAEHIFSIIEKFAGYGFNKSHAAAYALVAYQTAWLKTHYPRAFLAASMTQDIQDQDRVKVFMDEAKRLTIRVLPPDINASRPTFRVEEQIATDSHEAQSGGGVAGGAIRYGLSALRYVGMDAVTAIEHERDNQGAFVSVADFVERCAPPLLNRRMLESLIDGGALDSLEGNRRKMHEAISTLLAYGQAQASDAQSQQDALFEVDKQAINDQLMQKEQDDWSLSEKLAREFHVLGFYWSAHPLQPYEAFLQEKRIPSHDQLAETIARGESANGRLAGCVVNYRRLPADKGDDRLTFLTLSDNKGTFDAAIFGDLWDKTRQHITKGAALLLKVRGYRKDDGMVRFSIQNLEPLTHKHERTAHARKGVLQEQKHMDEVEIKQDKAEKANGTATVVIELHDRACLPRLQEHLAAVGSGDTQVLLRIRLSDNGKAEDSHHVTFALKERGGWALDSSGVQRLRDALGEGADVTHT